MVEFSTPPEILYNYTETDLRNPTVIKNSYSKTIIVEGTPSNNQLFGDIWNLERRQDYGAGYTGPSFNALQKAPFEIYVNGELYESGYVKLQDIVKNGNKVQYEIGLFGGLGQFFYNLTYTHNEAGEVEGPDKLQLKDLSFCDAYKGTEQGYWFTGEPNLDFKISRDTIWDAWNTIDGDPDAVYAESAATRPLNYLYNEKWKRIINFAPSCYNGIPDDFDTNKVLFRPGSYEGIFKASSGDYTTVGGYALGEANEPLSSEMTFDLRSYFQRPVIKMSAIIDACGNPQNNGGYEVKLGKHFFNNYNPYYTDSWVTLKSIYDIDVVNSIEHNITGATLVYDQDGGYRVNFQKPTGTSLNYFDVTIDVHYRVMDNFPAYPQTLYTNTYYTGEAALLSTDVKYYKEVSCVLLQLIAYDSNNTILATSNVVSLQSTPAEGNNIDNSFSPYKKLYEFYPPYDIPVPEVKTIYGHFVRSGSTSSSDFYFNPESHLDPSMRGITFSFSQPIQGFDHLVLKTLEPSREVSKERDGRMGWFGGDITTMGATYGLYSNKRNKTGEHHSFGYVHALDRYSGDFQYSIMGFTANTKTYEGLYTGTKIKKDKLLATDHTPAEYLIDFCKQFGLYFYRDASETSSDPNLYPNGVIHILDRSDFYHFSNENSNPTTEYLTFGEPEYRPTVVNLEKLIDRSKEIKITPQLPATKWYDFNVEQLESDAERKYKSTYEMPYGLKRINTGYNFDAETTDVYNGNIFRGAPMVQERDKYFYAPSSGAPVYVFNGFKYSLYKPQDNDFDILEVDAPQLTYNRVPINLQGMEGYDSMPRVQLHDVDNKPIDGDGVLLFKDGTTGRATMSGNSGVTYFITDDVEEMGTLNGGAACWLMNRRAYMYKIAYTTLLSTLDSAYLHRVQVTFPNSTAGLNNIFQRTGTTTYNYGYRYDDGGSVTRFTSFNNITSAWTSTPDPNLRMRKVGNYLYVYNIYGYPISFTYKTSATGSDINLSGVSGPYLYQEDAYPITYLPYFTRTLINEDTKYTKLSWDFGNPQEVYIPNIYNTDEQGIFYRCWDRYIKDMYSVDNRKLTCYVQLNEKPNPEWLRRFYWFDNSLWMLNKISDWSVSSYESTQMEFIKVQDLDDYDLQRIFGYGIITIEFDPKTLEWDDLKAYGKVHVSDGGNWSFQGIVGYHIDGSTAMIWGSMATPWTGSGLTTDFEIACGANNNAMPRTIYAIIEDNGDNFIYGSAYQDGNGDPYIALYCFNYYNSNRTYTVDWDTKTLSVPLYKSDIEYYDVYTLGAGLNGCYVEKDNVIVKINEYSGTTERTGTVTAEGYDEFDNQYSSYVSVKQRGAGVSVNTGDVYWEPDEDYTQTISFTALGGFQAEFVENSAYTPNGFNLKVDHDSHTVTVAPNRSGLNGYGGKEKIIISNKYYSATTGDLVIYETPKVFVSGGNLSAIATTTDDRSHPFSTLTGGYDMFAFYGIPDWAELFYMYDFGTWTQPIEVSNGWRIYSNSMRNNAKGYYIIPKQNNTTGAARSATITINTWNGNNEYTATVSFTITQDA